MNVWVHLSVSITRCAAKDWVLSLRAREVKYWTHLSTSDWGRDARSCLSPSSADKPCVEANTLFFASYIPVWCQAKVKGQYWWIACFLPITTRHIITNLISCRAHYIWNRNSACGWLWFSSYSNIEVFYIIDRSTEILTSSRLGSAGERRKNLRSTWGVRARPTAVRWSITWAAVWYW